MFFDPAMILHAGDRVRILTAAPVLREMIRYARRWPIEPHGAGPGRRRVLRGARAPRRRVARRRDAAEPPDHDRPARRGCDRIHGSAPRRRTLRDVCNAVGASERSLRRAFVNTTGMSWRQYLQESRLLKSMALLAEGDQSTITDRDERRVRKRSAFTVHSTATPVRHRSRIAAGRGPSPPRTNGTRKRRRPGDPEVVALGRRDRRPVT